MQMNKFGLGTLPQECQPTDYGHYCLLYWSIYKSNVKNQHDNYPVLLHIALPDIEINLYQSFILLCIICYNEN